MILQKHAAIAEGIEAVEQGNTALALELFSQVKTTDMTPLLASYQAYCLACEQKTIPKAINMGLKALQDDGTHPLIYLNLGRIYYSAGNKNKALDFYRQGLRYQKHPLLLRRMEMLNVRRRRLFPFLSRANPLNVVAGKILAKIF
ncbi:TPR repeat-containing protein [Desulfuromusa kysingii]|uniref:TPR repeat-containing protein n=1 Tax=Desulfuromusa kysingii TaxID=37625 RepID=A0A1H4C5M8_9BACT|nr:tetratricopeptide repeat protein [Desulfuromusa kysingii]SEA55691.1 TPR repeat-containing protein [Desulfuromusa kysingii]